MLTNFQFFFTVRIRRKFVIILLLKIPPHLKCVATLPCECQCLKATIENKTSVTTHFKQLLHHAVFLHQMFNVSALLLDDALLKYVVTEIVLFSVVAFKTHFTR